MNVFTLMHLACVTELQHQRLLDVKLYVLFFAR